MTTATAERQGFYPGWLVLAGSIVISWTLFAVYLVGIGPSTVPLQQEFGWSRAFITGAYSLGAAVGGFGAPICGVILDRIGPRITFILGAVGLSVGAFLNSLTDSSGFLWYAGWVVMMAFPSTVLAYVGTGKIVSYWFLKRRGTAMGLMVLAGAFSYIMATVHAILIESYGWRGNWQIFGVASGTIILLVAIFLIRNRPEERGWLQDGARRMSVEERAAWAAQQSRQAAQAQAAPSAAAAAPAEYSFGILEALRTYVLWLVCIAGMAATVALNIQTTQQVPFLEGMGISRVVAGAVLGTMGLIGAPGRFIVGVLIDRFGKNSIRFFYALSLFLEAAGMVILIQARSVELVWVFAVVFGLGQGMSVTAPVVLIANYFGAASYSTIYAIRIFLLRFGTVGGPLFAAWVFDTTGSYQIAFVVTAVVLVVASVLLLFARPPKVPIGAAAPAAA